MRCEAVLIVLRWPYAVDKTLKSNNLQTNFIASAYFKRLSVDLTKALYRRFTRCFALPYQRILKSACFDSPLHSQEEISSFHRHLSLITGVIPGPLAESLCLTLRLYCRAGPVFDVCAGGGNLLMSRGWKLRGP